MLNKRISEYFIGNEGTPWNVQLFEVMQDNYFDEGVVENTSHLMLIFSFLDNICHLVNAPKEIIRYVKHINPCEINE